jgi:glycosyltransferase involved in cell wall biosynthesis
VAAQGVTWLGWVPHHELHVLVRAHDALVVPSRWEGFGLVALEAMRAGRAVVASDRGSLPEIVDDGRTGVLVRPLSPERLAATLGALTRPQLESMGAAGRRRYEDEFTAERMNRQTLDLYRSVSTRP